MMTWTRDPRSEATAILPDGYEARVLEPSPPANTDPDWYADDPTDPGDSHGTIVTPIDGEGVTWDEIARSHPDVSDYVSDHWLGSLRRLEPVPAGYSSTRRALHEAAFFALAPKRYDATGKMGLRYTHRALARHSSPRTSRCVSRETSWCTSKETRSRRQH